MPWPHSFYLCRPLKAGGLPIDRHSDLYSVAKMCRLFGVSRSGFIQWRHRPPSGRALANAALDANVASIHAISGQSYGRPRIVHHLLGQGILVGPERVRRSLQRQQLRPVYKKPYRVTTDSDHVKPVAPNILERRFDGWQPNQAWVADITYIHTNEGWLYLACVLDLGSRRIVGWSMSERMKAQLACDVLKMAYWRRKPLPGLIVHSDRGVQGEFTQYASGQYRADLTGYKMQQSMSRRANCWDNAAMESFFKTLKVERVHRLQYPSRLQARLCIVNWVEGFYNAKRLHSSIDFKSPVDFEHSLIAA